MSDPISDIYLKSVVNEAVESNEVASIKDQNIDPENKATKTANSSDENVDLETPSEDKEHSVDGTEGTPKKLKESKNPFDALYNSVLREETFNFSTDDGSLENDFEGGGEEDFDFGSEDEDESFESEFGDEEDETESDETVEISKSDLEKLKAAFEVLQTVLGEDEVEEDEEFSLEDGEDEDFDDEETEVEDEDETDVEDEDETEETFKEEVDAEKLGHALVDTEKLNAGLNKHSNFTVKGAVPVTKKSATVPTTGKKTNGKIEKQSKTAGDKLKKKGSVDAKGVKTKKFLFAQN